MKKLTLDIHDDKFADLEELRQTLGLGTLKEVFSNAVTLLAWVAKERQAGRAIASVDDVNQLYKELDMPCFENIKPKP